MSERLNKLLSPKFLGPALALSIFTNNAVGATQQKFNTSQIWPDSPLVSSEGNTPTGNMDRDSYLNDLQAVDIAKKSLGKECGTKVSVIHGEGGHIKVPVPKQLCVTKREENDNNRVTPAPATPTPTPATPAPATPAPVTPDFDKDL